MRFKDVYIEILVLSIFETNQGVTKLKKPQEELINWYQFFTTTMHHRSVMLMSYVIQSCSMRAIGCEAESTLKTKFSSCRITFRDNVTCKKLSFSYGELNVVLAIHFSYVASNFVKWNKNSCHCIKFHTLFLSFCRIRLRSVDMYLCLPLYLFFLLWIRHLFSGDLKLSFLLVHLVFFFKILAFSDKSLCSLRS